MENLVKYILRSSHRVRVLQAIGDDVKFPTQIANESGVLNNHISRTLRQLREHELVELINPEARCGRLYRLTDTGHEALKIIADKS